MKINFDISGAMNIRIPSNFFGCFFILFEIQFEKQLFYNVGIFCYVFLKHKFLNWKKFRKFIAHVLSGWHHGIFRTMGKYWKKLMSLTAIKALQKWDLKNIRTEMMLEIEEELWTNTKFIAKIKSSNLTKKSHICPSILFIFFVNKKQFILNS